MLTSLALKRWIKVNWDKTATLHGFGRYYFLGGMVPGLEEESTQVENYAHGSGGTSTTLKLAALLVFFRADWERVNVSDDCRYIDEYPFLYVKPEPDSGVDLDTLFDQDLLKPHPEFCHLIRVDPE